MVTLVTEVKRYVSLHLKYLLFLSDFNQSRQILVKTPYIKFHENPASECGFIPCRRTGQRSLWSLFAALRTLIKTFLCCIIAVKLIHHRTVWSLLTSNESKLRAVYLDEEGFRLVSCYRPVLLSHLLEGAPRLLSGSMTHTHLHQLLAIVAFVPFTLVALCSRGSTRHSLVSL